MSKTELAVDPAELWERYCEETPRKHRYPQGAMAYAVAALRGSAGSAEPVAWLLKAGIHDISLSWTKAEADKWRERQRGS